MENHVTPPEPAQDDVLICFVHQRLTIREENNEDMKAVIFTKVDLGWFSDRIPNSWMVDFIENPKPTAG